MALAGALMPTPGHKSEQTGQPGLDRIQQNVRDLVVFVRNLEWLRRRAYVATTADTTTSSASYVELMSTTITSAMASSYLVLSFTASGVKSTNAGTVTFQIVVDGTAVKGCSIGTLTATWHWNAAIVVRVPVVAGLHTVRIDWATTTASVRVNAASLVDEHASLHVFEEAA